MTSLFEALKPKVNEWRSGGYPHPQYSSIAEILEWASDPEGSGFRLRPPQQRALETYWYLRLVEGTPHITETGETVHECQEPLSQHRGHGSAKRSQKDSGGNGIN